MSSCPLQRSLGRIKYGTHYLNRHWRVYIIVHSASCNWPLHLCVIYGCWSVRIKISVRLHGVPSIMSSVYSRPGEFLAECQIGLQMVIDIV